MKLVLTPEYPNFYFKHRGYWCKLELGRKDWVTDRNGHAPYRISYNNSYKKNDKAIVARYSVPITKRFKSFWERICDFFTDGSGYGEFTLTQEEVIQESIKRCINEVNRWDDICVAHSQQFAKISQKLEYEIPD